MLNALIFLKFFKFPPSSEKVYKMTGCLSFSFDSACGQANFKGRMEKCKRKQCLYAPVLWTSVLWTRTEIYILSSEPLKVCYCSKYIWLVYELEDLDVTVDLPAKGIMFLLSKGAECFRGSVSLCMMITLVPGVKPKNLEAWPLISIQRRGKAWVEQYFYSYLRMHGMYRDKTVLSCISSLLRI